MILRGSPGKGDQNYSINMVNMETVQMIRILPKEFNNSNVYRIVAYVNTGASITGPIGVVLNHPATKTERSKPTTTQSNSTTLNLGSASDVNVNVSGSYALNSDYRATQKRSGNATAKYSVGLITDTSKDTFYSSRDTDNLYLMRQIMVSFNDNLTRSVNGIVSAISALNTNFIHYKNDSRAYYSGSMSKNTNISIDNSSDSELKDWGWLKGNASTEAGKPKLDEILRYKPKTKSTKLYGFIDEKNVMDNGIEIVELGEYATLEAATIEFNKIQREYSKYMRGDLSCFNPPKVYQLTKSSITKENVKPGDPYDRVKGASYRFTTEVYKSIDGRIIADCGWYINDNYWLRAGVDYDIDFPRLSDSEGGGVLKYRFKGQYSYLGVSNISVAFKD